MASRKEKRARTGKTQHPEHMAESSPNPHGENKVVQMPIRTHQGRETAKQNIGQTTSTVGGDLNPSVAHDLHIKDSKSEKLAQSASSPAAAEDEASEE